MSDASATGPFSRINEEPIRRGSPDYDIRLYFKGNFHRIVEVTNGSAARENARRGK